MVPRFGLGNSQRSAKQRELFQSRPEFHSSFGIEGFLTKFIDLAKMMLEVGKFQDRIGQCGVPATRGRWMSLSVLRARLAGLSLRVPTAKILR
jgi:hypothetical protein